ncbi:MAG TPA: NAD-dependent epimerase/dehydratase family protein [Daejeonella sp.]|nr:NAD-dependent epimerase/dehydratase family protein [Daejeonella sp.]
MSYKAIIIGASGLVGGELLKHISISDAFHEILLINRRPLTFSNNKIRQIVIDFDQLADISGEITGDVIFSCLGTTRKKTPDAVEYRKIEYDYTVKIAQYGLSNQVRQFHYVSSLGANASSSSAYLKLKGEVENKLRELPFSSLHIYQPSFLTGERQDNRIEEKLMHPLMQLINPLLVGQLRKYQSISAETVAKAMLNQSIKSNEGIFTYPSDIIKQLA